MPHIRPCIWSLPGPSFCAFRLALPGPPGRLRLPVLLPSSATAIAIWPSLLFYRLLLSALLYALLHALPAHPNPPISQLRASPCPTRSPLPPPRTARIGGWTISSLSDHENPSWYLVTIITKPPSISTFRTPPSRSRYDSFSYRCLFDRCSRHQSIYICLSLRAWCASGHHADSSGHEHCNRPRQSRGPGVVITVLSPFIVQRLVVLFAELGMEKVALDGIVVRASLENDNMDCSRKIQGPHI